jgi:RHH-type proline utilization regulon transcriptional repressor/proline dehydrogenase/delta 1-pyrroline-5-carboxylate dehydrogenase
VTATGTPPSLDLPPFRNEPIAELRRAVERERLSAGLRAIDARPALRVPVWVGDERRDGDEIVSTDPGAPDRVVALAASATEAETDAAVRAAERAFGDWSARPARERAAALVRAAAGMRERRAELAALAVRECAKPWDQADGDVCEAIDFLEFYARGALALERGKELFQVPGERNALRYMPRGVAAVIAPWNFPLAIPMGMVSAALATGNTAVLKPAEQSPACGLAVVQALRDGGVPADAIALTPGEAATGAALVRHPGVATIAFTGSGPVGLEIIRAAADVPAGGRRLKRVVAEMGGKNCVIVDSDADLDDAVPSIVASAFRYAGQKCSAAARVLVHEAIHDALLERLAGAVEVLQVGQADAWGTDVPPLIERAAQERVERYRAVARDTGRIAAERAAALPAGGWFVAPAIAADLPPDSPVLREEIFGPLLAVERVRDVDHACDRVDELSFALTGGLFCRNPDTVERVVRRSPVGNLYVNREITGAMVGRQPFGGNRLSGTGTKAGGPDYLLHFVEPQVVTENTVRHGLVV